MIHVLAGTLLLLFVAGVPVSAADTRLLSARVADIDGRPMAGAKLFLYDSVNVRRPADFISELSGADGTVRIALPPGKYWGIARFKADGKYGPLLPGDKHSGEPQEIDLSGGEAAVEFVVADLRELGQKKQAGASDAVRISGRILDADGQPVAAVFAYATAFAEFSEVPEFVSAWTGTDGVYELFVPAGRKFLAGASRNFPLKIEALSASLLPVEAGKIGIAIDMNLTVK